MIGLFAFTMCFRRRTHELSIIGPDDLRVTNAVIEHPSDQRLCLLFAAELLTGPGVCGFGRSVGDCPDHRFRD
jgi:hypothetical protein